ncbi:unnamed protein product [Effrenium voratum]|nr:unnamed protein product [Effrenium voratum]
MEDYREAQRAKWLSQKEAICTFACALCSPHLHLCMCQAPSAPSAPKTSASRNARRIHILPVYPCPCEQDQRLQVLSPILRQLRADQAPSTDFFIEGQPLKRFEKVQFICLWDFERARTEQDATTLFRDYINPYFKERHTEEATSIVTVNEHLQIADMEFQVVAAEPTPPEIGIVDLSTVVFVDWDNTPEFAKIHFVPFQDTLPAAYEYDIFNDYLKPYLSRTVAFALLDNFSHLP